MIEIHPAQTPEDFSTLEELQKLTFNWSERNLTPRNTLKAWSHSGGIVLCAFDGSEIVGFVASFLGEIGKKRCQWSHLAGVLPSYRRQGIARQLKFAQREMALAQGIDLIGWTFDPLRRENAIFNLQVLGVRCHLLHENFYGEMSGLSAGRPTDRFEVHWHLKDARVKKLAQKPPNEATKTSFYETYVTQNNDGVPTIHLPTNLTEHHYALKLPHNLDNPLIWYEAIRATIKPLFAEGYGLAGVNSSPDDASSWAYILQRGEPWFLYVVETSDGTLYTGITNKLAARIQAHNTGKGAAYTAARRPVKLIAAWEVSAGKPHASRLEHRFKMLSRSQKFAIIQNQADFEDAKRLNLVTANLNGTS